MDMVRAVFIAVVIKVLCACVTLCLAVSVPRCVCLHVEQGQGDLSAEVASSIELAAFH